MYSILNKIIAYELDENGIIYLVDKTETPFLLPLCSMKIISIPIYFVYTYNVYTIPRNNCL